MSRDREIVVKISFMILNRPGSTLPLRDFGISIPIAPDRVGPVLAALRADPVIGPREVEWLIGPDGTAITREDLLRVITPRYADQLYGEGVDEAVMRAFELVGEDGTYNRFDPSAAVQPLSLLFEQALRFVAGTYQCGREALTRGFCFFCGGGSHHGHADFGHGFCMINDAAIAIRRLQAEDAIRTAWVIDVDVHKGDGTAAIMAGDESVRTLSVHMAHGWPLDREEFDSNGARHPSFIPSDVDVPIDVDEETTYLPRLGEALAALCEYPRPDLVYVQAGADPYEKDGLPSSAGIRLTLEQMNKRNRMIYDFLTERDLPQAWLMSGGYGESAWEVYPDVLNHALRERMG